MTVVPGPGMVPAFLQLGSLSDTEEARRQVLVTRLRRAQVVNARQESYYEGSRRVRDLGIAIPPHLVDLEAVAAFPEIVVDVIDERMDWKGWITSGADDFGLAQVYASNHLAVESGQAFLAALIYGLSYLTAGTGDVGEPDVLVKAESPKRMTATWSPRLRRCTEALAETYDAFGRITGWQLYLPGVTITTERVNGRLAVTNRDEHGLDRIPVSVLLNRPQAARVDGRSEITRAIRSHTDSAMRTLLGAEVAREFYGAPQRYLMGADEAMFVDLEGNKKSQWDAVIGKMLAIPRDDNDNIPTAGTFASQSPAPFIELLKMYSQLVSAASGVPASHFGFVTANPPSADSIRETNTRLDKRAIRRATQFDMGLVDLAETVILWRDKALPPAGSIGTRWADPSTPTPAAAGDRAQKLIAAGVLPAESDVTLEQLGFSDQDITRIKADRLRLAGRQAITDLGAAAAKARQDATVAALVGNRGTAP